MALDLNLLKCFAAVAETGNISKAGSTLNLSQPAISTQIKKLEEQVGQTLFNRHNRGLTLSEAGVELLAYARRIAEIERSMITFFQNESVEPSGVVRVGSYTTATSYLVSAPVTKFLRSYPNVAVNYDYDESKAILRKVGSFELDCAILSDVPQHELLDRTLFFKDRLVFAASPSRPEAKKRGLTPKELVSTEFLSYPHRTDLCYRRVERHYGSYLAKARIVLESTSFDTLKQMLLHGAGCTFIPRYLIAHELMEGKLVEVPVDGPALPIHFYFVTRRNSALSRATRALHHAICNGSSGIAMDTRVAVKRP